MTSAPRIISSAALRGGICAGVIGGGLVFPLDFFTQIESLRMTLSATEFVANASFAWMLYVGLWALTGSLVAGVLAAVLLLFRRYDDRAISLLLHIFVALFVAQLLVREAFRFVPLHFDVLRALLIEILVVAFAVWLVKHHRAVLDRVRGFLNVVTVAGAIIAALTFLATSIPPGNPNEGQPSGRGSRARVILITIDALAANRMSLYGYFRDTTPALKEFAQEAFVFDRHYSNGNYTTSSIGSILTGTRPWTHRIFQLNSRPVPSIARAGLIPTLKRSGYSTLVVATNPYATPELHRVAPWVDQERLGKAGGADYQLLHVFPTFGSVLFFPTLNRIEYNFNRLSYRGYTSNLHFDPRSALAEARNLLAAEVPNNAAELLWIHLFPPHSPYASPPPFLRSFEPSNQGITVNDSEPLMAFAARTRPDFPGALSGRYDESVRYVDYHVGRFLEWLRTEHYYDDSLIIVTADHGESFAHSYGMHTGPMLYEDLIHVPLLVKLPHQHTGAHIRDLVTEHADLFPTILDSLDLPLPDHLEGRSLRPVMEGRSVEPRPVYAMSFEQNKVSGPLQNGTVALVDGPLKYVHHLGKVSYPFMPKLMDSLYDVISDPGEKTDLAVTRPDVSARMRAAIDAAVSQHSLPKKGLTTQ